VHLERFESALWQTSSLLLIAEDEAIVVDPCITADEVAAIAARAAELGASVSHVCATHADWDHVCGIAAFPEAVAAMGELTAAAVAGGDPATRVRERAREYGIVVAGDPRVDRVLEAGLAHGVGPFVLETIALAGHTPDGTAYRSREPDFLAVGDHLSTVEFPFASSTAAYRATLAALIELLRHDPPELVVPGHGPPLTAVEALAVAEADLDYLRSLRAAAAGVLARGGDADGMRQAALAVELPRPAPDDLDAMRAANVEAQLDELLPRY
jgi:hydroxyacylglutathione hydrolase